MNKKIFLMVLFLALFQLLNGVDCPAQKKKKTVLPRVSTIKDYPATGLIVGCGNSYYYFAHQAEMLGAEYVFISNGDGRIAWMNLNGRDTHLKFVKNTKSEHPLFRSFYRWRKISIVVFGQTC